MKKIYALALPALAITILSGCTAKKGSPYLMISEYIAGTNSDQAIEIYNDSDAEISLKDYSIGIYSVDDAKGSPKNRVSLEGTIAAKSTYVITNSDASTDLANKANLKSATLSFYGKEGISLMYKNTDLDVIGALGYRNDNSNIAYVRKTWMTSPSTSFNTTTDYLYYQPADAVNYLGEFKNSVTEEELFAGPKFTKDLLDIDFYSYTTSYKGAGGAIEVTLATHVNSTGGNVDGDTSYFYFPEEANVQEYMIKEATYYSANGKYYGKVRYQEVDTPETQVQNNKVEEFGWPAKLNTAELQNNADHIYVQSNANASIVENYGRMLGFVFVTNGDDSTLVNFDTIKKGYSTASLVYNGYIKYKDCPYYNFFVTAEKYAKDNGKGLYGEQDPYWDYVNNKSKML